MIRSMPISLAMARSPFFPTNRIMIPDKRRIRKDIPHARESAPIQVPILSGSLLAMSSRAAIADGPAISGIASGTINGSSCSLSPLMPCWGYTIPMAIRKSTIPPVMLRDDCFRPRRFSIGSPAMRKNRRIR